MSIIASCPQGSSFAIPVRIGLGTLVEPVEDCGAKTSGAVIEFAAHGMTDAGQHSFSVEQATGWGCTADRPTAGRVR
jgi:hypothetical protein